MKRYKTSICWIMAVFILTLSSLVFAQEDRRGCKGISMPRASGTTGKPEKYENMICGKPGLSHMGKFRNGLLIFSQRSAVGCIPL